MAAVTLLESAKQLDNTRQKAALQIYASEYHPTSVMGFVPAESGGVLSWTVEDTLGSAGGRAIGTDFTPSNGTFKPYKAVQGIYGGKVQIDRAIRKTNPNIVPAMKANKIRGFAKQWVVDMFEGQGDTSLRGISHWITNDYTGQKIDASGVTPTMALMDQLYDLVNVVEGKTFFYMGQKPFRSLNTLSRTNGSGQQNIVYAPGMFGARTPFYNNVPIVVMKDGKGNDILSTAETSAGAHTGGALTSIYAVSYGDGMFTGFQTDGMAFIDFADDTNFENFTMEHLAGVAPQVPRCVGRLFNVANT
jgi:hypothetical protein